jgi:hypothetical protein
MDKPTTTGDYRRHKPGPRITTILADQFPFPKTFARVGYRLDSLESVAAFLLTCEPSLKDFIE